MILTERTCRLFTPGAAGGSSSWSRDRLVGTVQCAMQPRLQFVLCSHGTRKTERSQRGQEQGDLPLVISVLWVDSLRCLIVGLTYPHVSDPLSGSPVAACAGIVSLSY